MNRVSFASPLTSENLLSVKLVIHELFVFAFLSVPVPTTLDEWYKDGVDEDPGVPNSTSWFAGGKDGRGSVSPLLGVAEVFGQNIFRPVRCHFNPRVVIGGSFLV